MISTRRPIDVDAIAVVVSGAFLFASIIYAALNALGVIQ